MINRTHKIKILVVDDDKQYTLSKCDLFRALGWESVGVLSESEAKNYLKENANGIDLALLDMYMESTVSGLTLVEIIKREYPWIITIILTAYGDLKNAAKCMEAGAFSYLPKDSPSELITQTIEKASERLRFAHRLREIPQRLSELRQAITELTKHIHDVEGIIVRTEDEIPHAPRSGFKDKAEHDG